ncbi:hypothetical protein SA2016_0936 [Sinomonas atrocyanea]|uniref:Uncharacterized protein n=1 Tax=Sinomonas atrocyanea TaxID=37927 RepID=A0A127A1U7_9MICC|nr:hypothetical protein [Sinomonas atrocyanea]AMM31622.1 hypothetical protein SA2016_0936 [Sinomonas atrocyanea]GEB64232.1 hypothetical protein SAT01_16800 [Sinomonas atrocyanea]GGG57439.1 hypothetical protein GCM10007172_05410 [Sinomonas atrocyanea]
MSLSESIDGRGLQPADAEPPRAPAAHVAASGRSAVPHDASTAGAAVTETEAIGLRRSAAGSEDELSRSQARAAARTYLSRKEVNLPPEVIELIVDSAAHPSELVDARIGSHTIGTGRLMVIEYEALTTALLPGVDNDRWLPDALYAADPRARAEGRTLAMPQPSQRHAVLEYPGDPEQIRESVDRSAKKAWDSNRQTLGAQSVVLPLTMVAATFRSDESRCAYELVAVDGNSRLVSAYAYSRLRVAPGEPVLGTSEVGLPLKPSALMAIPLSERIELGARFARAARELLEEPDTTPEARNTAAEVLSALTVPVRVIVGYQKDGDAQGRDDFRSAVRALLTHMNVGVKPFDAAARDAVMAEEIVTSLHQEGLVDPHMRDVLIGRENVDSGMQTLGLDPTLPDLRFALVIQQLTRSDAEFKALVLSEQGKKRGRMLKQRNGPVVDLGLRSYSARGPEATTSARTALTSGCLWAELVDEPWEVQNVNTDAEVDKLLAGADEDDDGSKDRLLLGVLGMVSLVMSGHLLAAAGSAEAITGTKIARTNVGGIIRALLGKSEGRQLLADSIKRSRADKPPRWWDSAKGELIERTWAGSDYNAHLRAAVRNGFGPKGEHEDGEKKSGAECEAEKLTTVQEKVREAYDELQDLLSFREANCTADPLPWTETEATFTLLRRLLEGLGGISEPDPEPR